MLDLKFEPLFEDSNERQTLSRETLYRAIDELNSKEYTKESIRTVVKSIFGNFAIFLDSEKDTVQRNIKSFVAIIKRFGIKPAKDEDDDELEESFSIEDVELVLEAAQTDELFSKKKEFIKLYMDVLNKKNESVRDNPVFKSFHKSLKQKPTNKFKSAASVTELVRQYQQAGRDFVAHTCQVTYKMLSDKDKDADIKELAKNFTEKNYSDADNKYLKDIKDIAERMHIDAAACAVALAYKNDETQIKDTPYTAKTTKDAVARANRYKSLFNKHYNRAHTMLSDAYNKGMQEAKQDLREGKSLKDPLTGEEINREILGPVWQTGSKINQFFSREPWNVTTFWPKLVFGAFNMLTSKTAKNIYRGIFNAVRKFAPKDKKEERDSASLWNVSRPTLEQEFDEYIKNNTDDGNSEENDE